MTQAPRGPGDPYSRAEYRRVIAWDRRIAREGPFLRRLLDQAPDPSVLDLGCGTGEHVAFFASRGARAMGLDRSEAMIEAAQDHAARGEGCFVLGEACDAGRLLSGEAPFGLAICLGNMLPHLQDAAALEAMLCAVRDQLLPGGIFLVQLLNYERIVGEGIRTLPVNVRPGDDGREIVFVRVMTPLPDRRLAFYPMTLELDPDADEPISVRSSRRVDLRAWEADELDSHFEAAGFRLTRYGDMTAGPYEPKRSADLVLVATRRAVVP